VDNRTKALHEAKRADSRRKHQRAYAAVQRLVDSGSRVTFARVAREADVSSWLVYNTPDLKVAIQAAIERQQHDGAEPVGMHPSSNVSHASLRTDLALARAEIKSLKQERDALKKRVERVLGDEIREIDRNQLTDRITELEQLLRTTQNDLAETAKAASSLTQQNQELSEQLDAVRILNQTLIRQGNAAAVST
jgi:chromosome segregation ATPase